MTDADQLLSEARRPLAIGIGGGGDVVGALATAEVSRLYHGGRPRVGGVAWERQPIDPQPGPRSSDEILDAAQLAPGVLLAHADTRTRAGGVRFGESHMAAYLGEEVVLVDVHLGPEALAEGIAQAARALEADLVVFVDVGGDVLAHGHEAGLGSPLCDALMLAAAVRMQRAGENVLGAIFGPGCDGELTLPEVSSRLSDVAAAGGLAGARGLTPPVADRLDAAIEHVHTEASASAVKGFRGAHGLHEIRGGRRRLELNPAVALTVYFDVEIAYEASAPLAQAVIDAADLDEANAILRGMGVRTELDWETERARSASPPR